MSQINDLIHPLRELHNTIRDEVVAATERASTEQLSDIAKEEEGDTIYAIDKVSEELIIDFVEREIAQHSPVVLIAEGLEQGQIVLPEDAAAADAKWRIIVDPIDGTRGLMYQKRAAWILTGVAPNLGDSTSLQDVQFAIQTEIPLVKQHLSDQLWVTAGEDVQAERYNRLTGDITPFLPKPSSSKSIAHGFAMLSRFFPGAREVLAEIDEEIVREALGPVQPGKAHCFEDQYICTGGQFYELMSGHDRFNADLRPLMEQVLAERGLALGICCHPYDVCSELIARSLGVIITDESGNPLNPPLTIDADVAWVGYANQHIRDQVEPLLQNTLHKRQLL
jgi:fructose-1,6-bisphosphatase/inositol monophosphatase family enzyme